MWSEREGTPVLERLSREKIPPAWRSEIECFFDSPSGDALLAFLAAQEREGKTIYPPDPFFALRKTRPEDVRVVILGQDPYHGPNQANGMAFSVSREQHRLPPSLKNIFKEVARETQTPVREQGDLSDWAEAGVLLLNTVLTVAAGSPASHAKQGWEELTDALLIRTLTCPEPKVFMLWGAYAQKKANLIKDKAVGPVLVLCANHPSPLSALRPPLPFIGCGHFHEANAWLVLHGQKPIGWEGGAAESKQCALELD